MQSPKYLGCASRKVPSGDGNFSVWGSVNRLGIELHIQGSQMVSEGRGVSPPMRIVCRAFEVAVHPRCWLPYVTEVVAGAQCVFRVTPFVVPRGQLVKVRVAVRTVAFVSMRRRRLCRWNR